ncbi:hypothetical protein SUGI_0212220 [Cryptomeria japonica]|nr:hypothetical protein SUGI_0212220 [Cryptomeria japonica]
MCSRWVYRKWSSASDISLSIEARKDPNVIITGRAIWNGRSGTSIAVNIDGVYQRANGFFASYFDPTRARIQNGTQSQFNPQLSHRNKVAFVGSTTLAVCLFTTEATTIKISIGAFDITLYLQRNTSLCTSEMFEKVAECCLDVDETWSQSYSCYNFGKKRKHASSSGAANSTGTGITPGPSANSVPSTPSAHTPGDMMSMASTL